MSSTIIDRNRPAEILLIEDNKGDAILTQRAFAKAKVENNLTTVASGEEAVSYLQKEAPFEDIQLPDIILLDLNLPKMNGKDVLKFIKNNGSLRHIPVIMLSSSKADKDVAQSYDLHANGYIAKPLKLEEFQNFVEKIEQFWFTLAVSPDPKDV